ncbi:MULTISPECIES: hypothetical protein [Laceyella]|jgi:2-isopropylmalate synthase|uniref:Uncharacterized protein n=1 Tax=Laceyella sediminis TaxID=573074 RepID=A0ABX5EPF6_9BACL|nr:hypothetical protein [Laceyella sediminis]MRG27297.1 hypothetical protein [Laceyella tengchongensis]PRZ14796.1 hypothetical protein CLV36_105111 [Laceyella sediminis]
MALTYPKGSQPRYEKCELGVFLDETLREGSERCLYAVDDDKQFELITEWADSGIRNIIVGSENLFNFVCRRFG